MKKIRFNTKVTSIGIMGCGWLGLPLAKNLIQNGLKIKGTTTSKEKITKLQSKGIDPYLIKLENGKIIGNASAFFSGIQLAIINIPPKLRHTSEIDYLENLRTLIKAIEASDVEKIMFISSTSVYKDTLDFITVSEHTAYLSSSDKAKILVEAENLFLDNSSFKTNIIRFSGLLGPSRNPATYLSGKENVKNPMAPINLIQLKDCIRLLFTISKKDRWGEIYNASFPEHPTRISYYTKVCNSMGIKPPSFDNSKKSKGKKVSSQKLKDHFGFKFNNDIY